MSLEQVIEKIGDRVEMTIGEFLKLTPIDPKTFPADIEMKFPVETLVELYKSLDKKNVSADEILDGSFLFNSINESVNKSKGIFSETNDPFQESLQIEGKLGEMPSNTFVDENDDFPRNSILGEFKPKRLSMDDGFKAADDKISFGKDVPMDDSAKDDVEGNFSFGQDVPQDSPAKLSFGNDIPQDSPVKMDFSFKQDSPAKFSFGNDIPQDSPSKFTMGLDDRQDSLSKFTLSPKKFSSTTMQIENGLSKYSSLNTNSTKKPLFDFSLGNDVPEDSPTKGHASAFSAKSLDKGGLRDAIASEAESRVSFQKELESDSFFQKKDLRKGMEASYFIANQENKEFGSTFGFHTTPVKKDLSKASNDEYLKYLNSPVKESQWDIKQTYINILDSPGTFEKSLEKLHSKIPQKKEESISLLENESIGNLGGFKSHSRIALLKRNDYGGSPLKNEYKSILEKFTDISTKIPSPKQSSPVVTKDSVSTRSPRENAKENGKLLNELDNNNTKIDSSNLIGSPIVLNVGTKELSPPAPKHSSNLLDTSNLIGSPLNLAKYNNSSKPETKENANLLDTSNIEAFATPSKKEKGFKSNLPVLSPNFKKETLTEIEDFKEFTLSPMKTADPVVVEEERFDLEKESCGDLLEHDTSMNIGELNVSRKSQEPIPPSMKPDIVPTNPFEGENVPFKLDEFLKDDKSVFEEQGQLEESKDPKKLVYQVSKPISPRHITAFRRKYSSEIDFSPEKGVDQLKKDNRRDSKSFGENHSQQFKDKIEYWKQTEQDVVPDNLSQSSMSIDTNSVHESESQIGGMVGAVDPEHHLELENRKLKKQLKKSLKQLESMEKTHKIMSDEKETLTNSVTSTRKELSMIKLEAERLEEKVEELESQNRKDTVTIIDLKEEIRELNKIKYEEEKALSENIKLLTQKAKDLDYEIVQKDKQIGHYIEQYHQLVDKQKNQNDSEVVMEQLKNALRENEKLQHLNSKLEQEIGEIKMCEVYEVQVDEKWVENRIKQVVRSFEEEKLFIQEAKDWVNEVKSNVRQCKSNIADVNSDFEKEVERAKQMKEIFFEMVDQKKSDIPECSNCQSTNSQQKLDKQITSVVENVFDNENTRNEQYSILQQEQYQLVSESQMSIGTPGIFEQKKKKKFYQINTRNLVLLVVLFMVTLMYNFSFEYEDYYYQIVDSIFGPPDRILI
ncbi:hypothetical protein HDV06_005074 [Boothiomyces sp. JEL0866]|nr:hypothetical protein HDV06_005074 [Boothiomyces sp. JEL0866]